MTDEAISPLRRRLIEDMAIRRLGPKTQYQYLRHVKRFADFVGRSADKSHRRARLAVKDARLTCRRCHDRRSSWRTSSATADRRGVPPMPAT